MTYILVLTSYNIYLFEEISCSYFSLLFYANFNILNLKHSLLNNCYA